MFRRLHGFPEVRALHSTNGRWDIVAELGTDTLEAFDRTLATIRLIDGIASTETSILLSSRKLAALRRPFRGGLFAPAFDGHAAGGRGRGWETEL